MGAGFSIPVAWNTDLLPSLLWVPPLQHSTVLFHKCSGTRGPWIQPVEVFLLPIESEVHP